MDSLEDKLTQLLPQSLDDIIRSNRDKAELHFSTDEEINPLCCPIVGGLAKGRIADWAFITLCITETQQHLVYLVGFNQTEKCTWMTSVVTGIGHGKVTTARGSIYELVGDSTLDVDLLHICATFHLWGVGRYLGMPHIFY
ncbi:MAG: hypothetical protein KGL40_05265 [Rhodocyclaceae bacterium]|nr:hypothetical protein [Rhodocyclaceae bacterium]